MASTRSDYVSMIWNYRKRREELKKKHRKQISGLSKKIKIWSRQIRRIDERRQKVNKLVFDVNFYFNTDIKIKGSSKNYFLAKNVYFKYGIENGIESSFLCNAIGIKSVRRASVSRRRFTKSFKSIPSNRKAFHDFVNYMKN